MGEKKKEMVNFKKALSEALADNQIESLMPSREYTQDERIYMQGYTDALADMLEDFNAEYSAFMENTYTASLN
jgi:hypothetical protein